MEKINIWGSNIPFNTGRSKFDDLLVVHKEWTIEEVFKSPDKLFNKNDTLNSIETIDTIFLPISLSSYVCRLSKSNKMVNCSCR